MVNTKVTLSGWTLDNPVIPASGTFNFGKEFAEFYDINMLGTFSFKGTTRVGQFGNGNTIAGRCVDEFIISQINAQMADTAAAGVEEYQITRFQISFGNVGTHCILFLAGTGQGNPMCPEHILDITAAIKAGWCTSAPKIGNTNVLLSSCDDFCGGVVIFSAAGVGAIPVLLPLRKKRGVLSESLFS